MLISGTSIPDPNDPSKCRYLSAAQKISIIFTEVLTRSRKSSGCHLGRNCNSKTSPAADDNIVQGDSDGCGEEGGSTIKIYIYAKILLENGKGR